MTGTTNANTFWGFQDTEVDDKVSLSTFNVIEVQSSVNPPIKLGNLVVIIHFIIERTLELAFVYLLKKINNITSIFCIYVVKECDFPISHSLPVLP